MSIPKAVLKYLDIQKYKYRLIEHKTVFTAWDKAQTEKARPQEVAKSLVVKADNDHILALVPSSKKLDKTKLLKVLNAQRKKGKLKSYKKIDLAKEVWMKKNLPGKVGATPPLAGLLEMPVYIDASLLKSKKIYLGSGEYTASILLNVSQYLKIEKPVKGNFSMKK